MFVFAFCLYLCVGLIYLDLDFDWLIVGLVYMFGLFELALLLICDMLIVLWLFLLIWWLYLWLVYVCYLFVCNVLLLYSFVGIVVFYCCLDFGFWHLVWCWFGCFARVPVFVLFDCLDLNLKFAVVIVCWLWWALCVYCLGWTPIDYRFDLGEVFGCWVTFGAFLCECCLCVYLFLGLVVVLSWFVNSVVSFFDFCFCA